MPREISVHDLKATRDDGERHALLDVRERGEFSLRQIPGATPVPRGSLEMRLPLLLPDRSIATVLVDDEGRRAALAARTLDRMDYRDVRWVVGGQRAWAEAGYPMQEGWGVLGKDYGERVSVQERIPQMTPQELAARREAGERFLILDSRSEEEYSKAHLPGAYSAPGGELPAAVAELLPDDETTVVVNCAGRTRSILGAALVRRMGLPNRVYAFKNGTMAWQMAGFDLEHGAGQGRPRVSERAWKAAKRFVERLAQEDNLRFMPLEEYRQLQESGRLHYLIDTRLPEEYEAGHIPGAVCCPAGQLSIFGENVIAVPDAPVVLADRRGIAAVIAASLLTRMGLPDVYVLDGGIEEWERLALPLDRGRYEPEPFGLAEARARVLSTGADELRARLNRGEGPAVIDVRGSGKFALGHLPGSLWIARGKLELQIGEEVPDRQAEVVTVSDRGIRATLAAATLLEMGYANTRVLEGGIEEWDRRGLPLDGGLEGAKVLLEEAKEDLPPVMRSGILARTRADMERYLAWEEELGRKYEAG
jgi:rhodanese-related sulfurtransferase